MYRKGRCKEDGAKFFAVVSSDRDNGHKLEYKRFPLNIRENVFVGMVTKHCPGNWWSLHP